MSDGGELAPYLVGTSGVQCDMKDCSIGICKVRDRVKVKLCVLYSLAVSFFYGEGFVDPPVEIKLVFEGAAAFKRSVYGGYVFLFHGVP